MARKVWHVEEIVPVAQTLITIAPSPDFAAGVMALATAVGCPVTPPRNHVEIVQAYEVHNDGIRP